MVATPDLLKALRLMYVDEDGDDGAYRQEETTLREAIEAVARELAGWYDIEEPLGRGGAGVVFKVADKRLGLPRALKLPRPKESVIRDSVKREMEQLVRVRHQNVISIHTLGETLVQGAPYPYFVMDYVPNAKDLRRRLAELLKEAKTGQDLTRITTWLASTMQAVARAVEYLHQLAIVHFDIKPGNILVDATDRPILSDLGYAKTRSDSAEAVPVGFTLFYAHPDLAERYIRGSSVNRILKPVAPKEFKLEWDVFALGKALLECLALVDGVFPESVSYDYAFLYLHLSACRMLDARNLSDDDIQRLRSRQSRDEPLSYRESWMSLGRAEFQELRYTGIDQVVKDFEKLFGARHVGTGIPELEYSYPHRVQTSLNRPAPFRSG
jgi:serine/threonine protein kinase